MLDGLEGGLTMRFDKVIHAIDLHAGGEPGRVIVGRVMEVPGTR